MNPVVLQSVIDRVRRARHRDLSAERIIRSLARAAHDAGERFARDADTVALAARATGFSGQMVGEAARLTFGAITESGLRDMVDAEFGDARALDALDEHQAPGLIAHFLAGNVSPPGIVSICCGLLVKAANIARISSRDPVFPAVFVNALRKVDPELAGGVELVRWDRADRASTASVVREADVVIGYGHDATIEQLRAMTGPSRKFIGYGQKTSVAVVTREALVPERLAAVAADLAFDVSVYDQQGCLSPQTVYVETGGVVDPRTFADALAAAMADYQQRVPRGEFSSDEHAAVSALKSEFAFRAANDSRVGIWTPPSSLDWLVSMEPVTEFRGTCLNRVIRALAFDTFDDVRASLVTLQGKLSTVGLSDPTTRTSALESALTGLGATRICPVGQMQRPPLTWRHDGIPNMACLLHPTPSGHRLGT